MRVRLCVHACVCVLLMLLLLLVLFWVVSHCYGDRRRLSTVRSFVTTRRSRKSSHDSRPSSTNVGEHAGSCGGMYVASLCVDHLSRRQIWSCACSLGSWPCSVPRSRWHRSLHVLEGRLDAHKFLVYRRAFAEDASSIGVWFFILQVACACTRCPVARVG